MIMLYNFYIIYLTLAHCYKIKHKQCCLMAKHLAPNSSLINLSGRVCEERSLDMQKKQRKNRPRLGMWKYCARCSGLRLEVDQLAPLYYSQYKSVDKHGGIRIFTPPLIPVHPTSHYRYALEKLPPVLLTRKRRCAIGFRPSRSSR